MHSFLAELAQTTPASSAEAAANWGVVSALSALASLALVVITLMQKAGGKAGERQIEPTSIAAITAELKTQTTTLNKLDREMGEVKATTAAVDKKFDHIVAAQKAELDSAFRRINAISAESTDARARLGVLERRVENSN